MKVFFFPSTFIRPEAASRVPDARATAVTAGERR
jgi:hypothetical protein